MLNREKRGRQSDACYLSQVDSCIASIRLSKDLWAQVNVDELEEKNLQPEHFLLSTCLLDSQKVVVSYFALQSSRKHAVHVQLLNLLDVLCSQQGQELAEVGVRFHNGKANTKHRYEI
ncbi:unnamed protein product, partial [Amoebophrya sp. A25]|eukprot:GSA25T00017427001.1